MEAIEANKIIARFMGFALHKSVFSDSTWFAGSRVLGTSPTNYTESLDALVPVWEKLGLDEDIIFQPCYDAEVAELYWKAYFTNQKISVTYLSIQEAAAIATAQAIQEL